MENQLGKFYIEVIKIFENYDEKVRMLFNDVDVFTTVESTKEEYNRLTQLALLDIRHHLTNVGSEE